MDEPPSSELLVDGFFPDAVRHLFFGLAEHIVELPLQLFVAHALHLHLLIALLEQSWLGLHLVGVLEQLVRQVVAVLLVEDLGLRRVGRMLVHVYL